MSARSGAKDKKSEVLYQRLGNRWYAFSVVNGDVFFAEVPAESITQGAREGDLHDPQTLEQASDHATQPGSKAAGKN